MLAVGFKKLVSNTLKVGAGLLAMVFRAPHSVAKDASSLTIIASKPAPTEVEIA